MNRLISIILIVAGIVLLIWGVNASDSIGSEVSRLFTGAPTDKSIWLLLGGLVALILGVGGFAMRSK